MTEVVLKGEIHTSESDLKEERELLVEGVDTLILEGQRDDAEYGFHRGWYATAMGIVGLVLFKTLYTDSTVLIDIAEAQGADFVATRESDADLVENAHLLVEVIAAMLFYGIFLLSVAYGLFTGNTLYGAVFLLGSALLPVIILRYHEMNRRSGELNRDKIVAEKIANAAKGDNRVVAVIGASHLSGVVENLPEDIEPEIRRPSYKVYSWQHAKEIAIPAFTAFSLVFVMYLVLLEASRGYLQII